MVGAAKRQQSLGTVASAVTVVTGEAVAWVSRGLEAERRPRQEGWYGFAGVAVHQVGTEAEERAARVRRCRHRASDVASAGVSTPRLAGSHTFDEPRARRARDPADELGAASPAPPAWVGWNATLYLPDLRGFELTAGVRNLLGTRDLMPTPGDYDRSNPETVVISRIPGEGRELHVKLGYSY